ncbi:hypothetical protein [Amycolatopsis nigrescens]|uniref:hypothetical protein n=1 Tax=Amycolatopsis nigrescens TaxID=381445 RepID=UPI00036C28DC|nr:hypothetical protein [Amycolatopsis nigrescens]
MSPAVSTHTGLLNQLRERLAETGLTAVPDDVLHRLALLVGEDEVRFVDGVFRGDEGAVLLGHAMVFTSTRAIRAVWQFGPRRRDSSSADAQCWGRHTLREIRIPRGSSESDGNLDLGWSADDGDGWPPDGKIRLTYDSKTFVLPLGPDPSPAHGRRLRAFLSELLDDL